MNGRQEVTLPIGEVMREIVDVQSDASLAKVPEAAASKPPEVSANNGMLEADWGMGGKPDQYILHQQALLNGLGSVATEAAIEPERPLVHTVFPQAPPKD